MRSLKQLDKLEFIIQRFYRERFYEKDFTLGVEGMLSYPFCDQTVTVYRKVDGGVQRTALENCFYRWEDTLADTDAGVRFQRKFLLIQPGEHQLVFPGDRVLAGVGPEEIDWDTFLPENTPTLGQVAYAKPWYWAGKIAHTEAGRK